jgi:outer membrane murein-binding lipoprotein Lpp
LSRSELLLRGRINPTKAAEWSSAVLELRLRCKSYQADMAAAREEALEAQDRATAAEARAEQAAHAAKLHRGDVKLSDVAAHNLQLSEKVLQLKLAESRLMREAHLLNEKAHFLQKVRRPSMSPMTRARANEAYTWCAATLLCVAAAQPSRVISYPPQNSKRVMWMR